MNPDTLIHAAYLVATLLFIVGLKMLSSPVKARKGNTISALAMLIAIVATLLDRHIVGYGWIVAGLVIGSGIGVFLARTVKMTGMPEMVALLNGAGGLASLLVGWAALHEEEIRAGTQSMGNAVTRVLEGHAPHLPTGLLVSIILSVVIGGVTVTGSILAWAKLSERISGKPLTFAGQNIVNSLVLLTLVAISIYMVQNGGLGMPVAHGLVILLSLVMGVLAVLPIGGADMPVVISLLNSYSGMAACATGFVIQNNLLIVAGALVGSSGIILTRVMCKAMNRSLSNVLFSGFGAVKTSTATGEKKEAVVMSTADAYFILEAASRVVIVPGYGMAVAQAQHSVKKLMDRLSTNGCEVTFAIHPVAGRMPGHMNVLLAEANVPYDALVEMETANSTMATVDVCIIIGANDVVNPAAKDEPGSPIYGMPIIEAFNARTVLVLKRSMASGFAGIENPLFYRENTRMVLGDAKATVDALVDEFKNSAN